MIEAGVWLQVVTMIVVGFGVYSLQRVSRNLERIHERLDGKADKVDLEAAKTKIDNKLDKDLCGKMAACQPAHK